MSDWIARGCLLLSHSLSLSFLAEERLALYCRRINKQWTPGPHVSRQHQLWLQPSKRFPLEQGAPVPFWYFSLLDCMARGHAGTGRRRQGKPPLAASWARTNDAFLAKCRTVLSLDYGTFPGPVPSQRLLSYNCSITSRLATWTNNIKERCNFFTTLSVNDWQLVRHPVRLPAFSMEKGKMNRYVEWDGLSPSSRIVQWEKRSQTKREKGRERKHFIWNEVSKSQTERKEEKKSRLKRWRRRRRRRTTCRHIRVIPNSFDSFLSGAECARERLRPRFDTRQPTFP